VDLTPYRAFITELAEQSGAFIRPLFGQPGLAVETKGDLSPVTAADRGAEELMRGLIAKKFPAHGIIGEEFGEVFKALNEDDSEQYRKELIETAACCLQAAANLKIRFKEKGGLPANTVQQS
jgi:3'-phosphoadenosine 5'-phosphosulfate (PAPS) 3'-phosphatase